MTIATLIPRFFNTELDTDKIEGIISRLTTELMDAPVFEEKSRKYVRASTPIGDSYWLTFDEILAIKRHFNKANWAKINIEQIHDRFGGNWNYVDKYTKVIVTLYFPLTFKDIFNRLTHLTTWRESY